MDVTSQHPFMCLSPNKNADVRVLQALKRNGMQISLDVKLEIRSKVKGHDRYGRKVFRKDVKLIKGCTYSQKTGIFQ